MEKEHIQRFNSGFSNAFWKMVRCLHLEIITSNARYNLAVTRMCSESEHFIRSVETCNNQDDFYVHESLTVLITFLNGNGYIVRGEMILLPV